MGAPRETPVAIAILRHEGAVLVRRRPADDPTLGGTWEFPGGKIRSGEAPENAALRELLEETGMAPGRLELIEVKSHHYPDRDLRLYFFLKDAPALGKPSHGTWRWIHLKKLVTLSTPEANRPVIHRLLRFGL